MTIDLTKINQPFGELDMKTKLALAQAYFEGKQIEFVHPSGTIFHPVNPQWREDIIYRLAPEPLRDMDPPWSVIADEWQWAARDKEGPVWLYNGDAAPYKDSISWCPRGRRAVRIDNFLKFDPGNKPWDQSLICRPEGV